MDHTLREAHGVGRGHWQALRTAQDNPDLTLEQFSAEAAAFYTPARIDDLLASLTDNGWLHLAPVAPGTTAMRITDAGRELLEQMSHTSTHRADPVRRRLRRGLRHRPTDTGHDARQPRGGDTAIRDETDRSLTG